MTTPKTGSINVHRGATQKAQLNTQAKPGKTSFADTLAAKVKSAADAVDPNAANNEANAAAIEDAKKQLGLELVKSILKNPKPGNIDRETPTNLDDE